jgi:hypothetical protein
VLKRAPEKSFLVKKEGAKLEELDEKATEEKKGKTLMFNYYFVNIIVVFYFM